MRKGEWLSGKQVTERMAGLRLPLAIRTVTYHAKEAGCPVEIKGGVTKYLWPDYLTWWVERERQEERRRLVSPELVESQKRKLAAEAETAELHLERLKGQTMPIEMHGERMGRMADLLAAKIKAVPGRYAHRTLGLKDQAASQAVWSECCRDLLTALSETRLPPPEEDAA